MLKIEFSDEKSEMEVDGTVTEIMSDVIALVSAIYNEMKMKDERMAEHFKRNMSICFKEGVPFMTEEELNKTIYSLIMGLHV